MERMTMLQYIPVVRMCAVKDKEIPYGKETIDSPEKVAMLCRELIRHADREYLIAIPVDAKSRPVGIEIVAIGKVDEIEVDIKNIFKFSISSNCCGLLIAHNHPSNDPEPSEADIDFTKRIIQAGELLNVKVLDSLVITEDEYVSIKEISNWWK